MEEGPPEGADLEEPDAAGESEWRSKAPLPNDGTYTPQTSLGQYCTTAPPSCNHNPAPKWTENRCSSLGKLDYPKELTTLGSGNSRNTPWIWHITKGGWRWADRDGDVGIPPQNLTARGSARSDDNGWLQVHTQVRPEHQAQARPKWTAGWTVPAAWPQACSKCCGIDAEVGVLVRNRCTDPTNLRKVGATTAISLVPYTHNSSQVLPGRHWQERSCQGPPAAEKTGGKEE